MKGVTTEMHMAIIFTTILHMSFTASYCIAAVILLRFFLKRQPKILSYLLWSVVLFRMLCPVTISSSFSLMRMDTRVLSQESFMSARTAETAAWKDDGGQLQENSEQQGGADVSTTAQTKQSELPRIQTVLLAGAWVWLAGMAFLIVYGLRSTYRLRHFLKKAVCVEEGVYEAEGLASPFVSGVIRPRVYLPAGLTARQREFVLAHERVHAARRDDLVKILAWLARCIHWFNPLAWLAFALLEHDMEMSCDEAVVRRLGMDVRQDYSRALVALSCEASRTGSCPPAFGEGRVKDRVLNILSYRKRAFMAVAALAVVLIVVVVGLSLDPDGRDEAEEQLRLGEKDSLVTAYAEAWCNRDGAALVELYMDEETAIEKLPMLEKAGGEYLFGMSSPWPDEYWRTVPTGEGTDEGTSEIRYYAWTSDPHVAIWKEKITFTKIASEADNGSTDSGYRVTDSEVTYLDSIASEEEYMDAYWGAGAYHFVDYVERGFVEAINSQTVYDADNGEGDRNAVYRNPETAAEYIMNLTGGTGTAQTASNGTAIVEYIFADGSSVLIPMIDANFDIRTSNTGQSDEEQNAQEDTEKATNREVWILDTHVWNAGAP